MSLLRDEKEVQLNDLLRVCRESAEYYETAADVLGQAAAAGIAVNLAAGRNELCRKLEGIIRSCGYFPDAADPDRQTVLNLSERIRAIFNGKETGSMHTPAVRLEADVQSCFQSVFSQSWAQNRYRELKELEQEFLRQKHTVDEWIASSS